MKKIAVVGGHGVGKTTLCQAMMEVIEERGEKGLLIGEVVRGCPYPINDGMCEKTALWTITRQISLELEAEAKTVDYVICDRSAFDAVLYLIHALRNKEKTSCTAKKLQELDPIDLDNALKKIQGSLSREMLVAEKLAMDWLNTYHKIVLISGFTPSKLFDDGVRSQDVQFGFYMDELFGKAFEDCHRDLVVSSDDVFSAGVCRLCKKLL